MPELRLGHEPNERSTSPPSPTTQWEMSHQMSVQVATLRFGAKARPVTTPSAPTDGVEPPVPRLD